MNTLPSNENKTTQTDSSSENKYDFSQMLATFEQYIKYWPSFEKRVDKKINNVEKKIEESDKKVENSQLSVIETLGLFVALFTFISIDIQILKSSLTPSVLIGLMFITLGALSFFIICLNVLVTRPKENIKNFRFIGVFIMTVLLLISGVWLVDKSNKTTYIIFDKDQFTNDYVKPLNKNIEDLQKFKECLKKGWQKICFN